MEDQDRTFVIAEAAGCHDGDLSKASTLVNVARSIGADAVKFQWVSSPARLAARRRAPEYLGAYRTLAFPEHWFDYLAGLCRDVGVEFMCTTYLPEDVAVVARYVERFKVSSFESLDWHFVAMHGEYRKPVILSGGMSTRAELAGVAERWSRAFEPDRSTSRICFLHCVSAYPCPEDQANLAVIRPNLYQLPSVQFAGLSDHTLHPWTGALAVAAGARIVEFHVRLDGTDPGNADYSVARTPSDAREYVANIRTAEAMMGGGFKCVAPAEESMLRYRV